MAMKILVMMVNNYNKFVGSFERNVLSAGRRLHDKGIEIGKSDDWFVPPGDAAPPAGALAFVVAHATAAVLADLAADGAHGPDAVVLRVGDERP